MIPYQVLIPRREPEIDIGPIDVDTEHQGRNTKITIKATRIAEMSQFLSPVLIDGLPQFVRPNALKSGINFLKSIVVKSLVINK
jgi:hypothetical protein